LGDIEGVVVVFGKAEGDDDAILRGTVLECSHFGGVDDEGGFDVLGWEDGVYGATYMFELANSFPIGRLCNHEQEVGR
jgi:hypothetical protein